MNRCMLVLAGMVFAVCAGSVLEASEVQEGDRRRLDAARTNYAQELQRAEQLYRNAQARANANLDRAYQNVMDSYERRGETQTVQALREELAQLKEGQELPEGAPATASASATPGHARLIQAIGPNLATAEARPVQTNTLADKEYVLLYFSAIWCGPCRAFTPDLVNFYNENRESGRFEVVFVSSDHSAADMQRYMREYNMAFPAVPFARVRPSGLGNSYGGRGIPNLVIVDREGEVVSGSYVEGQYVGPRKVLQDMRQILAEAE